MPVEVYCSSHGLALSCGFTKVGLAKIDKMMSWWNGLRLTGHYQPLLLRDIFAYPCHPPTIDLSWQTNKAVNLAQAIYDDRQLPSGHLDTARLSILADALEEAGCTNAEILDHCRSDWLHVKGCWAVDLILGKE